MQSVIIDGVRYVPQASQAPRKINGEALGDYMRRLRSKQRWTLRFVADSCATSINVISTAERGRNTPRLPVLIAVADLFGITVDTLIANGRCAK